MGRLLFNLDVSFTELPNPRYFRKDVPESADRAVSWMVSWTELPPATLNSKPTSPISFMDLHGAMVDFGRLLSSPFACCTVEDEPMNFEVMAPSVADEKFEALQATGYEELLLRATPAPAIAAAWCDEDMESCARFWSTPEGTAHHYEACLNGSRCLK